MVSIYVIIFLIQGVYNGRYIIALEHNEVVLNAVEPLIHF